tara:strand:+ start:109130 stop:109759 length:630 start_codon:yes stop_codon:yes gene_type:complete
MSDKYVAASSEAWEPGSSDQVLKNHLGITSVDEIEKLEAEALYQAELKAIEHFDVDHQFTEEDVCWLHQVWLERIYSFAGKYRSVNISKDNFIFASANLIPTLMPTYSQDYLKLYTPCNNMNRSELITALAIIHIELVLIHPFREGNGRLARLLATLMVLQAGFPPLDFDIIDQLNNPNGFVRYIKGIHAGVKQDYRPMEEIFAEILGD